jgi:hypothetical protein
VEVRGAASRIVVFSSAGVRLSVVAESVTRIGWVSQMATGHLMTRTAHLASGVKLCDAAGSHDKCSSFVVGSMSFTPFADLSARCGLVPAQGRVTHLADSRGVSSIARAGAACAAAASLTPGSGHARCGCVQDPATCYVVIYAVLSPVALFTGFTTLYGFHLFDLLLRSSLLKVRFRAWAPTLRAV